MINHALHLSPAMSQSFFKTLSGKEAMPMPFAPVVMLPQVFSSFRCSAPSISQTHAVGASGFTGQLWHYSAASVPQCAERPG